MTRQELLDKGILSDWVDEITLCVFEISENTYGEYDLYEYIYDTAFQEATSDYPDYNFSINYHITGTDGKNITMLVLVEGVGV